jgi:TRAP-type uncharacterized transport system substrate-binding protein
MKALLARRGQLASVHASLVDFDPKTAWKNSPAPLHPGAARAYRELGFMREA